MKKAVARFLPTRSSSEPFKPFRLDIALINDFYLQLDEPHRIWAPGEAVTGVAVLDLKRNVADVCIVLTLMGYIKVRTSQSGARNRPTLLFRHTSVVYGYDQHDVAQRAGEEPSTGLSRGEHRFPFSVKLPKKSIYTSISFEKGSINYSLRADISHQQSPQLSANGSPASQLSAASSAAFFHSKNSIQHCEKELSIVVPINVARLPKPQTKHAYLRITDRKLLKTMSSASTINSNTTQDTTTSDNSAESLSNAQLAKDQAVVRLSVDLLQSGFLRGELIPIKICVSHYRPLQISSGIIVTLIRVCRVDNGPEAPIQSFRKDLCQTIAPLYIDPETLTAEVSTSLRVPADAFPTIVGSEIVTFQYYIEILANVSNKNIIRNVSSKTSAKAPQKFSHSIVFDLNQQHDHMTLVEDGMVNVDNMKRAKNMLGLNTEIIVGTERVKKSRTNVGKKTILHNARVVQQQPDTEPATMLNDSEGSILDGISTTSISPINIGTSAPPVTTIISAGHEITDFDEALSEKEILRRAEEALLPSEPNAPLDMESPLPSYDSEESNSEYSAPPMTHSSSTLHSMTANNTNTDKAELERQRLLQLESEPPEFDYVPEYNPAGQEYNVETGSASSLVPHSELDTLTG